MATYKGYRKKFSEQITKVMEDQQLSDEDLERLIKERKYADTISHQSINSYRRGTSFPQLAKLVILADTLGVSVDYLLGFQEGKNTYNELNTLIKKRPTFFDILSASEDEAKKENKLGLLEVIAWYACYQKMDGYIGFANSGKVLLEDSHFSADLEISETSETIFKAIVFEKVKTALDNFRSYVQKRDDLIIDDLFLGNSEDNTDQKGENTNDKNGICTSSFGC